MPAQYGEEGIRQLVFALRDTLSISVPMAFGISLDQFEEQFRSYVTTTLGRP